MSALSKDIRKAVALLRKGELIAFPTETVYGLGADASNPQAVRKIFVLKGRPADHPVIVHLPDAAQLSVWGHDMPRGAFLLAEKFWPGPLTLIVERSARVPDAVTGGQATVGLRVPAHPVALELLREFGGGIAGPSANRFGHISPTSAQHVRSEFGDAIACILDGGPSTVGIESTILDMSGPLPAILRPGHIRADQIEQVLGIHIGGPRGDSPRVSGALESHYAPRTPLILAHPDVLDQVVRQQALNGPVAVMARRTRPRQSHAALWQVAPVTAVDYAQNLYALLRRADEAGCRYIVLEDVPTLPEWHAVRDRIGRAATERRDPK
jgi:L-threonylcarbamoyladenylate synthase